MDWVFDHHRMTRINQAMLDQYQSKEEDFLGLTPRDLLGHDLVTGMQVWTDLFDHGRLHLETDERRRNGEPLSVLGDYICLYDDQGRITGHFGIQIDITAQKRLEAELAGSRDQSRELAEKATKASKAKSEFLANMSHEIRTPLNGVVGFSELLLKTPLTPLQKSYGESIATSAKSLLGVINDILDFSKIEAGKLEIVPEVTDLRELLEQTLVPLKFQADQKTLELLLDIQPDMPQFALVDPLRLRQILVNLLGNAVKFTHKGEVELKVRFQDLGSSSGRFTFSVRDTGIGITETQKASLFQAFAQGDATTTRQYGGTGLGLAISRNLTLQMGSPLEVESTPDIGSTFRFILDTSWKASSQQPDRHTLQKVLVVDDNERSREILSCQLEHWGLTPLIFRDGSSAVAYLKNQGKADAVILDYRMPGMNGQETLRAIRSLSHSLRDLPAVLLTGAGDMLGEEPDQLTVCAQLAKPVTTEELRKTLLTLGKKNTRDTRGEVILQPEIKAVISSTPLILLVDDVKMNLTLLKSFILQVIPGAKILEAHNGLEALAVLEQHSPQLIFMDVQMPEMDGLEATRHIKNHQNPVIRTIPTIALTAGALQEEKNRCLEAGMEGYLSKPIDTQALKALLNRFLRPSDSCQ